MRVDFRTRLTTEILGEIIEMIARDEKDSLKKRLHPGITITLPER